MTARRFVVYALARTGSTTLMRALNLHSSIKCVNEPFNENNFHGMIRARVSDPSTLAAEISLLWETHNGIKHVWHPSGWPFLDAPYLNEQVALSGDAVVLLERRNILRRVVSSQMSQQSRLWDVRTDDERHMHVSHRFVPLDRSWIKSHIARERETIANVRQRMATASAEMIHVTYEELYESEAAVRARTLERVLTVLLGQPACGTDQLDSMLTMLTDPRERLNSPATYSRVPGIHEIEAEFGCDQTGWLFR